MSVCFRFLINRRSALESIEPQSHQTKKASGNTAYCERTSSASSSSSPPGSSISRFSSRSLISAESYIPFHPNQPCPKLIESNTAHPNNQYCLRAVLRVSRQRIAYTGVGRRRAVAVWHEPQGRGERRGGVARGHARAGFVVRLADYDEAQVQIGEDLVCGKIKHERSARSS